jgi:dethiobiotin synthetase
MSGASPGSCLVIGARPGVGQTLIASALVHALCASGLRAVGMKPVVRPRTSVGGRWVSAELERLAAVSAFGLPSRSLCALVEADAGTVPATRSAQTTAAVLDTFAALATWADAVVVDADLGSPHAQRSVSDDTLALAREMQLPIFLVVSPDAESEDGVADVLQRISAPGLACAGWIVNHPQRSPGPRALGRRGWTQLAARCPGRFLGEIGYADGASVRRIARCIDPLRWFTIAEGVGA